MTNTFTCARVVDRAAVRQLQVHSQEPVGLQHVALAAPDRRDVIRRRDVTVRRRFDDVTERDVRPETARRGGVVGDTVARGHRQRR